MPTCYGELPILEPDSGQKHRRAGGHRREGLIPRYLGFRLSTCASVATLRSAKVLPARVACQASPTYYFAWPSNCGRGGFAGAAPAANMGEHSGHFLPLLPSCLQALIPPSTTHQRPRMLCHHALCGSFGIQDRSDRIIKGNIPFRCSAASTPVGAPFQEADYGRHVQSCWSG